MASIVLCINYEIFASYRNPVMLKKLTFATLLAASTLAQAHVLVASDNFDSYNTGNLHSQNGGSGWAGSWSANSGAENVTNPGGTNWLAFTGNSDTAATRSLSNALTDKVIVDFNFQYSGTLNDNDFLGLWFGSSTGPNVGIKGNCGNGNCTNDLFVRTNGTNGSFAPGSNLLVDTTYHVLAYLYKSAAGTSFDRIALWVDPTAEEMASLTGWDAQFSGASNLLSVSSIGFRSVNLDPRDSLRIDDLRIQTVPEPGSLALLGGALIGIAALRRKMAK